MQIYLYAQETIAMTQPKKGFTTQESGSNEKNVAEDKKLDNGFMMQYKVSYLILWRALWGTVKYFAMFIYFLLLPFRDYHYTYMSHLMTQN